MNSNDGDLMFAAGVGTVDWSRAFAMMNNDVYNLTGNFTRSGEQMDQTISRVTGLLKGAFAIGSAHEFFDELVKIRGEFQQIENSIGTIVGSDDKMRELVGQWKELTLNSPFRLSEIAGTGKTLLAMGIDAQNVTKDIKMIGNVAAGISQPINEIGYIFGQVKSQGKAMTNDLNQFAQRGIPIFESLAKVMGTSSDKVKDLASQSKIGFPEIEAAFADMTGEGGKFFNLLGKQANTIPGQINRVKHEFELMMNEMGESSEGFISKVIGGVGTAIEHYKQIGDVVVGLIATYGAYKAALMVNTALEQAQAVTLAKVAAATNAESGSIAQSLAIKLKDAEIDAARATAVANLAKTKLESIVANEAEAQSNLESALKKETDATATLELATAEKNAAAETVASIEAKIAALGPYAAAQQRTQLQTELGIAKEELHNKVREESIASIALEAAEIETNNASKVVSNTLTEKSAAIKEVEVAVTEESTAANALNAVANEKVNLSKQIGIALTNKLAAAQEFLNATFLESPIGMITVALASLTYAIYKGITAEDEATVAHNKASEAIQNQKKITEDLRSKNNELISTIQSSTSTLYEQVKAYEALKEANPALKESMDQIKSMSSKDINVKLNAIVDDTELDTMQNKVDQLKDSLKNVYGLKDDVINDPTLTFASADEQEAVTIYREMSSELEKMKSLRAEATKQAEWETKTDEQKLAILQAQKNSITSMVVAIAGFNTEASKSGEKLSYVNRLVNSTSFDPWMKQLGMVNQQIEEITKRIGNSANGGDYDYWEQQVKDRTDTFRKSTPGTKEWVAAKIAVQEAQKKLDQWNTTEVKPKKAKIEVVFTKGSISALDKQIEEIQKKLKNTNPTNTATISSLNKQLVELTQKRADAQKAIEIQTVQKSADEAKKLYDQYYEWSIVLGDEVADKEFSDLLKNGSSYSAYLENQLSKLKSKIINGTATKDDQNAFTNLQKQLDELTGKKSNLEQFTESLQEVGKGTSSLVEQLGKLKKMQEDLNGNTLMNGDEKLKAQAALTKQTAETQKKAIEDVTNNYKTFAEKRADIEKKYDDEMSYTAKLRDAATSDSLKSMYSLHIDQMQKEKQSQLDNLNSQISQENIAALKKEGIWNDMFENMEYMSRQSLQSYINRLKQRVEAERSAGNITITDYKNLMDEINTAQQKVIDKNPFAAMINSIGEFSKAKGDLKDAQKTFDSLTGDDDIESVSNAYENVIKAQKKVATSSKTMFQSISAGMNEAGAIGDGLMEVFDKIGGGLHDDTKQVMSDITGIIKGGSQLAQGIATGNPIDIISGSVSVLSNAIDLFNSRDRKLEKKIAGYRAELNSLTTAYKQLQRQVDSAVGDDIYSSYDDEIANMQAQIVKLGQMRDAESQKKKKDQSKIDDYNNQIQDLKNSIEDTQNEIAKTLLQTDFKDLSSNLADAFTSAFEAGEDSASAFKKTWAQMVTDMVKHSLQLKILEPIIKQATDAMTAYMDDHNNSIEGFDFSQYESQIKAAGVQFTDGLKQFSSYFQDLADDTAESGASGITEGVTEQTATILQGQMEAIRINQASMLSQSQKSDDNMKQVILYLAQIEINTRYTKKVFDYLTTNQANPNEGAGIIGH